MNIWVTLFCAIVVLGAAAAEAADSGTRSITRAVAVGELRAPVGMIYDRDGALYVAEWGAGRVSKFDADGKRTVLTASVSSPSGLAFNEQGTLFVASYTTGDIYTLSRQGKLAVLASDFSSPAGLLWSRDGALLVANRNAGELVKVDLGGKKEVIAKNFKIPVGIAQTADGSIWISCYGGGIDRIAPDFKGGGDGRVNTVYEGLNTPGVGMVADGDAVLVVDYGGTTVTRVDAQGRGNVVADGLRSPVGLARMPDGRLLVGTWGDNAAFIMESK